MTTHRSHKNLPDNDSEDHCTICVRMKNDGCRLPSKNKKVAKQKRKDHPEKQMNKPLDYVLKYSKYLHYMLFKVYLNIDIARQIC